MTEAPSSADPVPAPARSELERIRRRWSQLPLPAAQAAAPAVRALVERVAAATEPAATVPDLGPAALVDQLCVVVWDAYAAGAAPGLEEELTGLRRALP
ncbi:hypothetical protein H9L10_01520 [Phycicoccus endophyticus]|uniref:Uncharacterized protein n=1 Tax=Phycicoccus endophyticus TaxID=1690220 RepID=A0A7G9R2H6_9MICO|nr:hypothetical protein [Phycicoccus endophyticus]NHI20742.1 hypothetical protein [Phycicoccus endophyticus]QNN49801.1 hypothetical protein H9L10_01520 [Phycicoccus endophyticus]GGL35244.1 hypothetical protein GCM10012283_17110 [Phycicoccus endophyticus]